MRKLIVVCLIFCLIKLAAREQTISPLPVPTQEVISLSVKKCSKGCLKKLIEEDYFFSFLSEFNDIKDSNLESIFNELASKFDIYTPPTSSLATLEIDSKSGVRVALLMPQKSIGRYSVTSADSLLLYLISRGDDFEFGAFDSINEDVDNLKNAYNAASSAGFNVIIAILTPKGVTNLLSSTDITTPLFIPSVNKKQAGEFSESKNVFFGGIDYDKQLDMIVSVAEGKGANVISLNDDGSIGKMLGNSLKTKSKRIIFNMNIDTKTSNNFKEIVPKFRSNIKSSIVVLNTSVIKSGLIVPQIGNTNTMPIAFLSTQINYNPSLLNLMPKEDAEKMFVISAINPSIDSKILAFGELMSADVLYDWVNYATALSLDVFLSKSSKRHKRFFEENLNGNQVEYNDRFYGAKDFHFVPVKLK
ncbi:hypothetical protein DCO58_07915 [Helicobacter saguini]|uniref:Periplasmic protein n=1 Tax=Helicobacter saguini TaxID=1548018 RepID=A0A347VNJ4_9HELI|nr:hypothetical protein [Helicobacter saguini]MWV61745.1 hypothetical protein [Helicobacter saguini]MWV67582.1 hypothetical protein [Helicobacter saguini]MWV69933.1 hypothetical protein [Helicobacter saguini]MWV72852.1 hypothetical protein [Helicobacter saguini]TLD92390.1 hypothetical protein LS64_010400 [Helicobacter saguini]